MENRFFNKLDYYKKEAEKEARLDPLVVYCELEKLIPKGLSEIDHIRYQEAAAQVAQLFPFHGIML